MNFALKPLFTARYALLAGLFGLALLARLLPGARNVDDSFITFRYSRNLVEGHGFVYNLGERVLGTTTPLYTLLMAGLGALFGGDYPTYALILNALAGGLAVLLIFLITEQLTDDPLISALAALLWSVAVYGVTFDIGGMETGLHGLFMLAAWYAYLRQRPLWLGAACALGFLTRPDALIWALPLLLHQLLSAFFTANNKKQVLTWLPLRTWGIGLAIVLPWLIFATLYFGNPIPQSVSAKANTYLLPSTQALSTFIGEYAIPFQMQVTLGSMGYWIGIFIFPALSLIGLRAASARQRRALPLLIYPWLYFAVFSALNPLVFRWYLTPPQPAYFIAILCGLHALLILIPRPQWSARLSLAIGLILFLFSLNAWELRPAHGPSRPAPRMAFHELELNYANMAARLRESHGLEDHHRLAAGDIGALGFYSRAQILDTIGLITRDLETYYADHDYLESIRVTDSNYVIPPDLIMDAMPDYVVVMEGFIRNGLATDARFIENYELIEFIRTDYYGIGMLAFQRQDLIE